MVSTKGVGAYLARLRDSAHGNDWRAVGDQLVASLRWRLSPAHRAMRAVMRENDAFDLRHGTDTAGEVPLEQIGVDVADARRGNGVYRAIPGSYFHAAMALLEQSAGNFGDYTFLDYGSGKGKALLLASGFPFRNIVGVEYCRALHENALANIERFRNPDLRCGRIEAVLADARSYEPPAQALVCFFFNPFDATIWRQVLGRLRASHAANPRPIHLVYVNVRDVGELEDLFPEFTIFSAAATTRTVRILSAPAVAAVAPHAAGSPTP